MNADSVVLNIPEIVRQHEVWIRGEEEGVRADLSGALLAQGRALVRFARSREGDGA